MGSPTLPSCDLGETRSVNTFPSKGTRELFTKGKARCTVATSQDQGSITLPPFIFNPRETLGKREAGRTHRPEKQLAQAAGWHDLRQFSAAEKQWQLFLASEARAFFMSLKMSRKDRKWARSGKSAFSKGGTRKGSDGDALNITSSCRFMVGGVLEVRKNLTYTPASSHTQTHPTYICAYTSTHRHTFPAFRNYIGDHEKQVISVINYFNTGTDIPGNWFPRKWHLKRTLTLKIASSWFPLLCLIFLQGNYDLLK